MPEDAFNELFEGKIDYFIRNERNNLTFTIFIHLNAIVQQSDHYEPTQKEQDELARALEEVDEQVKSLEQMTGSTHFLDNFLNVDDEILVDSSEICDDVMTTAPVKSDIRGLVHT